jgi:hypothetical protein
MKKRAGSNDKSEENCQSVSRFFMEQNGVEIGFTGFEFGQ